MFIHTGSSHLRGGLPGQHAHNHELHDQHHLPPAFDHLIGRTCNHQQGDNHGSTSPTVWHKVGETEGHHLVQKMPFSFTNSTHN